MTPAAGGFSEPTKDFARQLYEQAMARDELRRQRQERMPRMVRLQVRQLVFLLIVTAAAAGALGYWWRPSASPVLAEAPEPVVMIDLVSGETFQAAVGDSDPVQELLDDERLAVAAWCSQCKKWCPTPSAEQLEKMPQGRPVCPRHPGTPLTAGP